MESGSIDIALAGLIIDPGYSRDCILRIALITSGLDVARYAILATAHAFSSFRVVHESVVRLLAVTHTEIKLTRVARAVLVA